VTTTTLERPSQAQLEYATITVAYVNPPKPGQKSASVKDTDGVYFWIRPAEQANFVPGGSYEISFSTTQSNGYTNRTIKSAAPVQQQARAQTRAQNDPAENYPSRQAARRDAEPTPREPQRQPQNGNGNYYRPTSPEDKKSMFRCACVTAFIRAGQLRADRNEIAAAVAEIDAGYDMGTASG
jgi:hypothetical protein